MLCAHQQDRHLTDFITFSLSVCLQTSPIVWGCIQELWISRLLVDVLVNSSKIMSRWFMNTSHTHAENKLCSCYCVLLSQVVWILRLISFQIKYLTWWYISLLVMAMFDHISLPTFLFFFHLYYTTISPPRAALENAVNISTFPFTGTNLYHTSRLCSLYTLVSRAASNDYFYYHFIWRF